MKYVITFNDGTVEEYDVEGWSGEPDIPFTLEFEVDSSEGYTKTIIIPIFNIRHVELREY